MQLLKSGDDAAASQIWERYFHRMMALARKKLSASVRRVTDEEDVAISAFHSFCRGVAGGRFAQLDDRNDLWQVLAMITTRKARRKTTQACADKRGNGQVRGESVFSEDLPFQDAAREELSPEFLALAKEELQLLLDRLPDEQLRQISLARLEGYSNEEIASMLGRHVRSVERKLQIIRQYWGAEKANEA